MLPINQYNCFSSVYDKVTDNECYQAWQNFVLGKFFFKPNFVVDLGCGTGRSAFIFAEKKLKVIGIDPSSKMLAVARKNAKKKNLKVEFRKGTAQNFKLKVKTDLIVSFADMLNHLLSEKELLKAFQNIYSNLSFQGSFFFEFNSLQGIKSMNLYENEGEFVNGKAFIWENNCFEDFWEGKMSIFKKQKNGLFKLSQEAVLERGYSLKTIKKYLLSAGFKEINFFDEETLKKPSKKSFRIYGIAKK